MPPLWKTETCGTDGPTRTGNLRVRTALLYPVELRRPPLTAPTASGPLVFGATTNCIASNSSGKMLWLSQHLEDKPGG